MEIYIVQPGDTLTSIAQRYGVSLAELTSLNQLPNPDRLVPGQAILIPGSPAPPLQYIIVSGDTLYGIARVFGTTVAAISQANNITNPNLILPGQSIIIPGWTQINYTVQPGDTLWAIGRRFGVPVEMLVRVNRIPNPSQIAVGQVLIIPQRSTAPAKTTIETLGYFHYYDLIGLEQTLTALQPYLTYAGLFQFPVQSDGTITIPTNVERAVAIMKSHNVQPLAVITNWGAGGTFDLELAHAILSSDAVRAKVVQNVQDILSRFGFAGVNVDFENMPASDRPLYTRFIQELAAALKPSGYLVTLAAPPKFADYPNAPWVGTFDYAALGQAADFIFLMTYEWGWIGGPPMAIAPINLVRRALTYALTQIPPEKILQGIPLYGYDWKLPQTPEVPAIYVNLVDVYNLAA
ncbi:MAG TPA: LysM peptidoglycan-binding domain-containing protein, partial [Bacillota bacterium]|nr:LysM peptidoglycan-binding domain-containing protein [Bacillota bacterium]